MAKTKARSAARPTRIGVPGKFDVMTAKELDEAQKELEFAKTSLVLGRPVDVSKIIEIAEDAVRTARQVDIEAKEISDERNEYSKAVNALIDDLAKDLQYEHTERMKIVDDLGGMPPYMEPFIEVIGGKLKSDADWFKEKAESLESSRPISDCWSSEYDSVRHERR